MLVLTPGYSVTLTLNAQDSVSVDTRDSVVVEAVSGLGVSAGVIATVDGTQTFGPYAAGQLKLTAIGGNCNYGVNAGADAPVARLSVDASGNPVGIAGISNIGTKNRLGRRLKIGQIGNSLAGYSNVLQGRQRGALGWANAYLHYGFSNIRSTAGQIGSDAASLMDAWGTYSYSGAVLGSQSGDGKTNLIIPQLPAVFAAWLDTPDIIMLNGICENDLIAGMVPNVICNNISRLVGECRRAYPSAIIVIATPYPSGYYTQWASDNTTPLTAPQAATGAATYSTVKAYIKRLASANIVVWSPDVYMDAATFAPKTGYTGSTLGVDRIHPNEAGALLLGRDCLKDALAPYAFPFTVPTNPAESASTPVNYFVQNSGFNCYETNTAAPVTNGTANGPTKWGQGAPANSTLAYTPGETAADGTIIALTNALAPGVPTATSSRNYNAYSSTVGSAASIGTAAVSVQTFARVKIISPVGLERISGLVYIGGTTPQQVNMGCQYAQSNTVFVAGQPADYPFAVGDEFTMATMPVVALSTATGIQVQMDMHLSAAAPVGATPAVQIKAVNTVKTPASGIPF